MTIQVDESGPFDVPKEHTYELQGATVIAQRRDPYGFFHLRQTFGNLPDRFSGAYTSLSEVERAMKEYQTYLNQKLPVEGPSEPLGSPRVRLNDKTLVGVA